jgi:iron complex transport system substrate-binding protein
MRAGGIALACLLAASCAIEGENRVAHGGHPTIVSLNPCTDAILADVAAPGQLLAISHYSKDPASSSMNAVLARRFRATSGSVEEVAMLAPDVVVAGSFLAPATRQALTDLGIRVVTLPIATDIAASQAQVVELARLTGNPAAGQELVRRIEASLEAAAPPEGAKPVPALVWEAGGIVAGDGTLIADMLQRTGFTNAAAARGLSQADFLPLERVVADPPRVIFAVGNAHSEEDRMLRHPAIRTLEGTDRVPLEGSLLWCGGPTIPRALEKLARERDRLVSRASSPRVTGT